MTVGRVLAGLKSTIRAFENKFSVKVPEDFLQDLPELKYKKSGGLTQASQKRLEVWRDVKRAELYIKGKDIEDDMDKLAFDRWRERIWDTLKVLTTDIQYDMGYIDSLYKIFEKAVLKKTVGYLKKNMAKIDDLMIALNSLLYEAQMWQSHDQRYRDRPIDIDILSVIEKIADLLGLKAESQYIEDWNQPITGFSGTLIIEGDIVA